MPAKNFSIAFLASLFLLTTPDLVGVWSSDNGLVVSQAEAANNKNRRANVRRNHSNRLYLARKRHIQRYNNRVVRQNHLQSIRRSGAVLANPHLRNPYYGYSNGYTEYYDNGASGVTLNGRLKRCRSKNNCGYRARGNRNHSNELYLARKRHLNRYNNRIVRQNHLQSIRRSGSVLANPHMINPNYGYSNGYTEYYNDGVSDLNYNNAPPCPSKHNCGYRVYSDGSGPRIITPGIPAGDGLPAFDGVSGPSIITPN